MQDILIKYRYQRMVTPYGVKGKMISFPGFQPVPMITVWDISLLWTYHISRPPRADPNYQVLYLMKMLGLLIIKISEMKGDILARPSTVTFAFSVTWRGEIKRYLFVTSIHC